MRTDSSTANRDFQLFGIELLLTAGFTIWVPYFYGRHFSHAPVKIYTLQTSEKRKHRHHKYV